MTRYILVTRPKEQSIRTIKILDTLNVKIICSPMIIINYINISLPDFTQNNYDYVLFTSINGAKKFSKNDSQYRNIKKIPVISIGDNTTAFIQKIWNSEVLNVGYDVNDVMNFLTKKSNAKHILYLRGLNISINIKERLEGIKHLLIDEIIVYSSQEILFIEKNTLNQIKNLVTDVFLYSTKTSESFINMVIKYQINLSSMKFWCLSQKIADTLNVIKVDPTKINIPKIPNENHLINIFKKSLCFDN